MQTVCEHISRIYFVITENPDKYIYLMPSIDVYKIFRDPRLYQILKLLKHDWKYLYKA